MRIAYIRSTFLVAAIPRDIPLYAKEFSLLIAKGGLVLGGLTLKIEPMYIQVLKKTHTIHRTPTPAHVQASKPPCTSKQACEGSELGVGLPCK